MERKVYQVGFDEQFGQASPQEVAAVVEPIREVSIPPQPLYEPIPAGRFVRELAENQRLNIMSPSVAGQYFLEQVFTPFDEFEQEELWALLLNTKNTLTHDSMIYRGNVNTVVIRMAEVFRAPVRVNATAIILGHNHPSGETNPSEQDVAITRSAYEAGQIMGIEVLDHMIIGKDKWVSLKTMGLGFA